MSASPVPNRDAVVAVIGLGYVGLPLAVEFARRYRTIGFDLSSDKVAAYRAGCDPTGEVSPGDLAAVLHSGGFEPMADPVPLKQADFIIIDVPTPVDTARNPDFGPLIGASRTAGSHLKPGSTVVFESTVYPGATEEVCIPELEKASGLKWKHGFSVGYTADARGDGCVLFAFMAGRDAPDHHRGDDDGQAGHRNGHPRVTGGSGRR